MPAKQNEKIAFSRFFFNETQWTEENVALPFVFKFKKLIKLSHKFLMNLCPLINSHRKVGQGGLIFVGESKSLDFRSRKEGSHWGPDLPSLIYRVWFTEFAFRRPHSSKFLQRSFTMKSIKPTIKETNTAIKRNQLETVFQGPNNRVSWTSSWWPVWIDFTWNLELRFQILINQLDSSKWGRALRSSNLEVLN